MTLVFRRVFLAARRPGLIALRRRSCRIWSLLRTLTREKGVVVPLVTDDLVEASHADIVCFLHRGRLVAEDTLGKLLQDFQCETLSGVYKKLQQEDGPAIIGQCKSPGIHKNRSGRITNTMESTLEPKRMVCLLCRHEFNDSDVCPRGNLVQTPVALDTSTKVY